MVKPTGPTNPQTRALIKSLVAAARKNDAPIWADIADRLGGATRNRPAVNVDKLERLCKKGDVVLVPGKLLATGNITKAVKVAALDLSAAARTKIEAAGGKVLAIEELAAANPSGAGVKIIK